MRGSKAALFTPPPKCKRKGKWSNSSRTYILHASTVGILGGAIGVFVPPAPPSDQRSCSFFPRGGAQIDRQARRPPVLVSFPFRSPTWLDTPLPLSLAHSGHNCIELSIIHTVVGW